LARRPGDRIVIRALRLCAIQAVLLIAVLAPLAASAEEEPEPGGLEPTYQPRPPPEKEVYSTDYLFAITRSVADSTLVPAAKVPLYFLTIPCDIVFLPIELIAGFIPSD
jgi:hypothetical protein